MKDKAAQSVVKSISWRITGTIDTMVISYFITGDFTMAMNCTMFDHYSNNSTNTLTATGL
ncbi:DUF2061 domain-containing protein [Desulfuromonas acetoxidans]|uniref:DUF2061 domain-containing protein n=1 Tax=Desulfuromonas acetoxidans TaxID=891 RepID=UPI002930CA9F|nr:DUF2061 domain-containing protein [Desulfuromonas acetoxidans]